MYEEQLNNWERKFIDGITWQLSKRNLLTYNQLETLHKPHAKVTDPKFTE